MTTTLTRGYTFGATEQVTNSKLHSLVDSGTITNLDENVLASGRGLVVSSTSAPSNTACVWNDTGNNLLKAYISSAWTNVADGSLFSNLANVPSGAGVLPVANGGASAATQAEMEAGSSTTKMVTPGRTHYHPGVAKAWAHFTTSGGTVTLQTNYNVTSIGDRGAGQFTANWATSFSTANYAWSGSCRTSGSTTTAGIGSSSTESDQSTSACQFISQYWTGGTLIDPDRCSIIAWGDV